MNTNHFASRLHLNEKKQPGCLGDEIGDEILPSSVGILINHYFGSLKTHGGFFSWKCLDSTCQTRHLGWCCSSSCWSPGQKIGPNRLQLRCNKWDIFCWQRCCSPTIINVCFRTYSFVVCEFVW